ncbi:hypothetical protein PG995_010593 [Apiospora arundinis]
MVDLPIVQYTGEPALRQTAHIPRSTWDERKPQIIALYDEHTLDEVIEKMTEVGFTANRRQYIYQFGQWGIAKYGVKSSKKSGSDNAFGDKRKHIPAGAENDDDHHNPSSSQVMPSQKRPKLAEHRMIVPDIEVEEEKQINLSELAQSEPAPAETKSAEANDNSRQPALQFCSLTSNPPSATLDELFEFLHRSRSDWGVSLGDQKGEGAFDIYALLWEVDTYGYKGLNTSTTMLSCVRSANSREDCQWVASFLEESKLALEDHPETWDALTLSHLMLARKLSEYGLQISGKMHAIEALQLRDKAFSSPKYRPYASCLHSIQDLYFPEVAKACDLQIEVSATKAQSLLKSLACDYSQLATDFQFIRSKLLSFSAIIMGNGLELVLSCEVQSLSATLFELVWRLPLKSLQELLRCKPADSSSSACGTSLPDFEGACCDLLAHLAIQHSKTVSAGIVNFHQINLVEIVSHMDFAQLYMNFVRAYCCRDWRCNLGDMDEPRHHEYYNIPPDLIYGLVQDLATQKPAVSSKDHMHDEGHTSVLPF